MFVYIIGYFLSISIAYSSKFVKNDFAKKFVFLLSSIPFIIISAVRYDVGTDYMVRYVPDYMNVVNGKEISNLEPIFYALIKLCTFFSSEPYILFAITSLFIYLLFFKSIEDNSECWILSITIFLIAGFFFQSMNLVRQFVAMGIIMYAHKFLFDKSNKKKLLFILFVIIAALIHSISLIYIILLILKERKINIVLLAIMMIIVTLFGDEIVRYGFELFRSSNISNIQKYAGYFRQKGNLSWSLLISEFVIYIFMYVFNKKEIKDEKKNLYTNMQAIGLLSIIISARIELFSRLSILFFVFQIESLPYFIKNSDEIIIKIKDKKIGIKKFFIYLIIILYLIRLVYSVVVMGVYQVLPYKTIFDIL